MIIYAYQVCGVKLASIMRSGAERYCDTDLIMPIIDSKFVNGNAG